MAKIDSHFFGNIIIDGKKFESDVAIHPNGEVHEKDGSHAFTKQDLHQCLLHDPEVIVIGTGRAGNVKIEPEVEITAKLENVELVAKKTPEAIKEFNKLARTRKVIASIHVTC